MATKVPETIRLPLDERALLAQDKRALVEYMKKLIRELTRAYEETANAINNP